MQIKGRKITVEIFSLHNSITEYLKCQCARLWGVPLRFYFWAVWTSQKAETRVHCSYAWPENCSNTSYLKERKWEWTFHPSVLWQEQPLSLIQHSQQPGKGIVICMLQEGSVLLVELSHVRLFVTPWTIVRQAPLSMEFSRLELLECVAVPFSRGPSRSRDLILPHCGQILYCLSHQGSPRGGN